MVIKESDMATAAKGIEDYTEMGENAREKKRRYVG